MNADHGLSHLNAAGEASMVDVSDKAETTREAVAQAQLHTTAEVIQLLSQGELPKGDALPTARIAGIMAAKKTSELIPLCHPLAITKVSIEFVITETVVTITATVKTKGVTGVEMEALTAASVAALTLYDMVKAVDRSAVISEIKLRAKSGGKSGNFRAVD